MHNFKPGDYVHNANENANGVVVDPLNLPYPLKRTGKTYAEGHLLDNCQAGNTVLIYLDTGSFDGNNPPYYSAEPCFLTLIKAATPAKISMRPRDLKLANTRPEATVCAACGAELRKPPLGFLYQHCPVCEP